MSITTLNTRFPIANGVRRMTQANFDAYGKLISSGIVEIIDSNGRATGTLYNANGTGEAPSLMANVETIDEVTSEAGVQGGIIEKVQITGATTLTKSTTGAIQEFHVEAGGSINTITTTNWALPATGEVEEIRIQNQSGGASNVVFGTGWTLVTLDGNPSETQTLAMVDNVKYVVTFDSDGDVQVLAASEVTQAELDLKAPLASPAFTGTVTGITKAMVGLTNVDDTSDANKPVSTAQQTALDLKKDTSQVEDVAHGGTNAATAADARTNLGLAIGTDVQAWDAVLDATTASYTTADEAKVDFITVTQAVDLDTIETDVAASKVKTDFITVTQAVDLDTIETDVAASKVKTDYITVTQAVDLDTIETRVNALDAAVVLQGAWDASLGTFPGAGAAQAGDSYIVSVGGTVDGEVFVANDRIIAILDNASTTTFAANWFKADYTDAVLSVASKTGAVTLDKTDVGLSNVDNTSDATKDAAIATLTNKTLTSPVINTPTGIVKGDVGLGNVDNTSDADKPVSTATQAALDLKAPLASPTFTGTVAAPDTNVTGTMVADKDNATSIRAKGAQHADEGGAKVQDYHGIFSNTAYATRGTLKTRSVLGANVEMDMEIQSPHALLLTAVDDTQADGVVKSFSKTAVEIHSRCDAEVLAPKRLIVDRVTTGTTGAANTSDVNVDVNSGNLRLMAGNTLGAPILNSLTETERDALTGVAGMIIFNETTSKLNFYTGSAWEVIVSA